MELAVAILVFAATGLLVLIFAPRKGRRETAQIMRRLVAPSARLEDIPITRGNRTRQGHPLEALLAKFNFLGYLDNSMVQAGIYSRASDVVSIMLLLAGSGAAAAQALAGDLALALACGATLAMLPIAYVRVKRKRRLKIFGQQLPEVLDLLKSSLQAGHSLLRGLQVVVEEFPEPTSIEFRIVLEQARLGVPIPRAFQDMLKRVPEESLQFLAVAIKVQHEVGSSLAEIVSQLAETIRTRQRIQLQIKALTAQPRMSGFIVGLLPVALLIIFGFIQPGYTALLFSDPMGIKILKGAVALDIIGFVVIRRVLALEY